MGGESEMKVYRVIPRKDMRRALEKGFAPSNWTDLVRIRRGVIFAYPKDALRYVSQFGDPTDVFVEIEVNPDKVYVADLRTENTPEYRKTVIKLSDYIVRKKYLEPEVLIPFRVTKGMLTGKVLERRTLMEVKVK